MLPDIGNNNDSKKTKDEAYAAFISDIHVGSKKFLKNEFLKFIAWLNGEIGNDEQKNIAKNVKYLFLVGDLVAGIGVYPGQENELYLADIIKQYDELATLLAIIRKDIKLIIAPGNHDAVRLAEPQPALAREYADSLYNLKNAVFVSSPSLVNIHASKEFEGFNVLLYHGSSFHHYADNVESLRLKNAKNNPALVWKHLLKRRHMAPTHGSTVYIPDAKNDLLLIDKTPDIVVNGDIHKSDYAKYNGITIISASCWEDFTEYQQKMGSTPDFCKVPLYNLKTKEVKMMKFKD